MPNTTIKTNAVSVSYEMLSDEGKVINKKQTFNFMSHLATDDDFFEIGKLISEILAYSTKEILKNNVTLLTEE